MNSGEHMFFKDKIPSSDGKLNIRLKMALICAAISITGLFILLLSNSAGGASHPKIAEITKEMAGERVIVCGIIKSKTDNGKDALFFRLGDGNDSISVVFFKDAEKRAENIKTGSNVCIEGNAQIYKGDMELIGRKLVDK